MSFGIQKEAEASCMGHSLLLLYFSFLQPEAEALFFGRGKPQSHWQKIDLPDCDSETRFCINKMFLKKMTF